MRKTLLYVAAASVLFGTSCKETLQPIVYDNNEADTSYSYTEAPETPQAKRIYIEELTGVRCINCPGGAEELKKLDGLYPGQLSIIAFHNGNQFTKPFPDSQDFRTPDGEAVYSVWGPGEAKPCSVIDRLELSQTGGNLLYVLTAEAWKPAIIKDKAENPTTPVNLSITSNYNSEKDRYEITATVKYTEAVTTANALQIFLSEDDIIGEQEYPDSTAHHYEFNHVFRKAITNPSIGTLILPDMATKEAGRVFVYKTSFKIDATDEKQKLWVPAKMHVTAFVSIANNPNDIHVLQVQDTTLIN